MKFKVKLPAMAGPKRLAGTVVVTTISPNCAPAGVFTESVVGLEVIVVVPLIFVKFTTFVPLMLNTPVVLNVTGSAFAATAVNAKNPTQNKGNKIFLTRVFICFSFVVRSIKDQLPINRSALPLSLVRKYVFKSPQSGAIA